MKEKKMMFRFGFKIAVVIVCVLIFTQVSYAHPTGAPLFSFPVIPCRILDTRISLGPLLPGSTMDVHARGSNLLLSEGAALTNCDIPLSAEAVKVNIAVVNPSSFGHLKVNATGQVFGPHGEYSRVHYRSFQIISNEIEVDLCNARLYPAPHEPCPQNEERFLDFQIKNVGAGVTPSAVDIVVDIVGYLARQPEE